MRIERTKQLSDTEKQQLLTWDDDIFESEQLDLLWRPKERHLVLYIADTPVSHCGLITQRLRVGTKDITVGGIGGVVTPPAFQGRGYAHTLLREALADLSKEALPAALLFCRKDLEPFYQHQGWETLQEPVTVLQPSGTITFPATTMRYQLDQSSWPQGRIYIDGPPW